MTSASLCLPIWIGLLLVPLLCAKKPPEGEVGTVLSQQIGSDRAGAYAGPVGGGVIAVPLYRMSNVVEIDAARYTYRLAESGRHPLVVPVNSQITFYHEGNWIVILDSKNKKHKFAIIGMTQKK